MNRIQHTQSYCRWQHSLSAGLCRCAFRASVDGTTVVQPQKMRPVGIKAPMNT